MPAGRLAALALLAVTAAASPLAGTWGTAREVPGMSALNRHGEARINSMSCASPGNCSAGGYYEASIKGTTYGQPFLVNEVRGVWHKAIPVPGVLALNTRKSGFISSVSCTRPGDCSAGGRYLGRRLSWPFVVDEVNGVWHKAITLDVSGVGDAEVSALACASPGNCTAAGRNGTGGSIDGLAGSFVVNEVRGRWHKPIAIPGKFIFVYGDWIQSASCAAPGDCTVGGWYQNGQAQLQAFVASEVKGTWKHYIALPGTIPAPGASGTEVTSLSCPKPGTCTAAGNVVGGAGFLASEVNGTWRKARPVPGLARLHGTLNGQLSALSCPTAGNCSAGGTYSYAGIVKGFLVNEVNGVWRNAIVVPGMRRLDRSASSLVSALSCPAPGNCSAGGSYPGPKWGRPFVVNEVRGTWRNAVEVPGAAALKRSGSAQVTALSCARVDECSAGGYYGATSYGQFAGQVFVVNER